MRTFHEIIKEAAEENHAEVSQSETCATLHLKHHHITICQEGNGYAYAVHYSSKPFGLIDKHLADGQSDTLDTLEDFLAKWLELAR